MKCCGLLSLLIGSLLVGPQAFGQDDAEENIHYERLKVLEPIIGTWSARRTDSRTGAENEQQTTYRWSATKRMIIGDSIRRDITDGQAGPWNEGGPRFCYVWNQYLKCIEVYAFYTMAGVAAVSRLIEKGDGEFEWSETQMTTDDWPTASITMTISDDEIVMKGRNRKSVDGEELDDLEWGMQRVTPVAPNAP
jgi:hypothetical protein